MAKCIIHGGKFPDTEACSKCKACRHESAWRPIYIEEDLPPDPGKGKDEQERMQFYAIRARREEILRRRQEVPMWRCNGCYKTFDLNEYEGEKWILYDGRWVEDDKLNACKQCGTKFFSVHKDTMYCSPSCKNKASRYNVKSHAAHGDV